MDDAWTGGPDGSPFFDGQSGEQPLQLAIAQLLDLSLAVRPLHMPILKPFVQQEKAVTVPVKGLEAVTARAAEEEERLVENV
nr:hypothetical protein [Schleiferilactobacillus harbinensis]